MRILYGLLWAFVFFTLFAFSLNNQHSATVHWFFGFQWTAPMVMMVLAAFAAGCGLGVLAMVPHGWRHRRAAREGAVPPPTAGPTSLDTPVAPRAPPGATAPTAPGDLHPPREGL